MIRKGYLYRKFASWLPSAHTSRQCLNVYDGVTTHDVVAVKLNITMLYPTRNTSSITALPSSAQRSVVVIITEEIVWKEGN